MWRRVSWLLPVLTAAACTGLLLDKGNAYPCDFSEEPGVRDTACQPGDVCGSKNLCQKYIYEGPRFEGAATVPVYGPGSGEGALLHPLTLNEPVGFVSRDLPREARNGISYVGVGVGRLDAFFGLSPAGQLSGTPLQPPGAPPMVAVKELVAAQPFNGGGPRPDVVLQWRSGELSIGTIGQAGLSNLVRYGAAAFAPVGFTVLPAPGQSRQGLPVAWTGTDVGFLQQGTPWRYVPVFDGGAVVDVAGVAQGPQLWVLAMTRDTLLLGNVDAGTISEAESFASLTPAPGADVVRTDREGRIVAAARWGVLGPGDVGEVLSTFLVSLGPAGPVLTRAWSDCRPCGRNQRMELFSPSVSTGSPVVEVLCMRPPEPAAMRLAQFEALRVVGSIVLSQDERCLTEALDLPIAGPRVALTPAPESRLVQWNAQSGLLVGGKHGEVWEGETLSSLRPFYLDSVPRDVTTIGLPSGELVLSAITEKYFTLQQTPTSAGPGVAVNGFRTIGSSQLAFAQNQRLLSFIAGSGGWAVRSDGQLVRAEVRVDGGALVSLAPALVTAAGAPLRDSIGGQGYVGRDGGLQALFIGADDSLYFIEAPVDTIGLEGEAVFVPDLTPEPSVPIRSFALEQTPLGTDVGLGRPSRARGYLVTSRNVFAWQLAGTPARWSSTPLVLASGEPEEVWFDSPRSALGRVGYSTGEVYSLPGGYELAEALPADDEGVPAQVLDYENLGGWPAAYATTGVFIAGWAHDNGKLQNRFPDGGINRPMSWTEVTLPDGGRPWMRTDRKKDARPGKLFVAVDQPVAVDGGREQTHRLLLFLDEQVLQVARHVRTLKQ